MPVYTLRRRLVLITGRALLERRYAPHAASLDHPSWLLCRRGVLNLDCALAVGHSVRYAGEANGESYMELVVRDRATSTADTHILKANHPDDARNWVRDLQARPHPM